MHLRPKVIFLGPAQSGKTSLVLRLCNNTFTSRYKATLGAEFLSYPSVDTRPSIQLWDLAGEPKFRSLGIDFVKDANRFYLVLSPDQKTNIKELLEVHGISLPYSQENSPFAPDFKIQVIFNKMDLPKDEYQWTLEDIQEELRALNETANLPFNETIFKVSAKEKTDLHLMRDDLKALLKMHLSQAEAEANRGVKQTSSKFPKSYDDLWMDGFSKEESAIRLLDDYCKGTHPVWSRVKLLFTCHMNRHHVNQVRQKLLGLEKTSNSVRDILSDLQNMDLNENGSLARRLAYIKEKMGDDYEVESSPRSRLSSSTNSDSNS